MKQKDIDHVCRSVLFKGSSPVSGTAMIKMKRAFEVFPHSCSVVPHPFDRSRRKLHATAYPGH